MRKSEAQEAAERIGVAIRMHLGLSNPWGVNESEARVLTLLCELGSAKMIGRALGLSPRTVEGHIAHARLKMNCHDKVVAAVEWDRFLRSRR